VFYLLKVRNKHCKQQPHWQFCSISNHHVLLAYW